jgi:5-methylcytosine-specific restriction endonuclease McrA
MPKKMYCSQSCRSKNNLELNLLNLKKVDREYQKKIVSERKGENHPRWIKDRTKKLEYHLHKSSIQWKLWRESIFKRDNYTCQKCGSHEHLQVHHINDFKNFKDQRIHPENVGLQNTI